LALSTAVGSLVDLAKAENAVTFEANDMTAIANALRRIAAWTDGQWDDAECTSLSLAKKFSPAVFAKAAHSLIEKCAS
jgi:hypothetical protein